MSKIEQIRREIDLLITQVYFIKAKKGKVNGLLLKAAKENAVNNVNAFIDVGN